MSSNNFSFDASEFEDSSDNAADEALQNLEETPAEEPDGSHSSSEDDMLSDVDLRLETADYYRAMLRQSFFDSDTPTAQIVDREIRSFVRGRLEVLLGIRSEKVVPEPVKVELPFDVDEINALKLLASKVLKRPALIEAPIVRKVEVPKPEIKAVVKAKPQVKKLITPPPTPITKPKFPPKAIEKTEPKKSRSQKPLPGAERQVVIDGDGQIKETLIEGDLVEEKGRKYRIVKNELGTLFKKDVTGQIVPPGVSRPMTPMEIEVQSRIAAEKQLEMVDQGTGLAILHSLKQR